jgi:thiol-disulfide isomerase/thioredoxin
LTVRQFNKRKGVRKMLERLLIAAFIIAAGALLWQLHNRRSLQRLASSAPADPALGSAAHGTPTILYFTTPFCAPCRTEQQPALQQISESFGASVQIIKVDASVDTETADRWGVFSAPTTFVLDANQQPRFVNRGVATHKVLADQLAALG